VAISLIANFTNVVPVPGSDVPKGIGEIRSYVIGSPNSPTDVHLTGSTGVQFGIRDGAVYYFCTPQSFFREQNPSRVPQYAGTAVLSSNQVLALASNTLQHLTKARTPLPPAKVRVKCGGFFQGKSIPFYQIEWPKITQTSHVNAADIEIDARTGRIVFLHLLDTAFFDAAFSQRIMERVSSPEPVPRTQP